MIKTANELQDLFRRFPQCCTLLKRAYAAGRRGPAIANELAELARTSPHVVAAFCKSAGLPAVVKHAAASPTLASRMLQGLGNVRHITNLPGKATALGLGATGLAFAPQALGPGAPPLLPGPALGKPDVKPEPANIMQDQAPKPPGPLLRGQDASEIPLPEIAAPEMGELVRPRPPGMLKDPAVDYAQTLPASVRASIAKANAPKTLATAAADTVKPPAAKTPPPETPETAAAPAWYTNPALLGGGGLLTAALLARMGGRNDEEEE